METKLKKKIATRDLYMSPIAIGIGISDVLLGSAAAAAPGPVSGSGIILESGLPDFLLLETGDYILLES